MPCPRIGLPAAVETVRFGPWEEPAAYLPVAYARAVRRGGGLPLMLVPEAADDADADAVLDLVDGLVLAGGADVDPASYGAEPHPETRGTTPDRDAFEIALVRRALDRDVPVLGICRGMQVLNVAVGGTLHQHLPDLLGTEEHRRVLGRWAGNAHEVELERGSIAARLAGETTHRALSHHHQGIDRLGDGVVVTGRSPSDGAIEAIELPGSDLAAGVQWHPEADPGSEVVARFVAEVAARVVTAAG